jgi:hypothetical protein
MPPLLDQLDITHLFTLDATSTSELVDAGPRGRRVFVRFSEGRFLGERLSGTLEPGPCHEEIEVRSDGVLVADVELVLKTDDGADILMWYRATTVPSPTGLSIVNFPIFTTADERYAWINSVQALTLQSVDYGTISPKFVYEINHPGALSDSS